MWLWQCQKNDVFIVHTAQESLFLCFDMIACSYASLRDLLSYLRARPYQSSGDRRTEQGDTLAAARCVAVFAAQDYRAEGHEAIASGTSSVAASAAEGHMTPVV